MWPLPCSHTLSQPWLCSRGDLPIAFRGTVIFSATFPSLTASPLSFVAVLTRSSCPIVPMMQSTLSNTPRTSILLLPQSRRSVAPLGTTSPSRKRLPRWLCVAVKFGVCVCECGKVTALKTDANHRFASCAAMQGFQPLFYCIKGVSDGSKWNVRHALPIVGITFSCSFALVLTLRVFIR